MARTFNRADGPSSLAQAVRRDLPATRFLERIRQALMNDLARTKSLTALSRLKKKEKSFGREHWKLAAGNEAKRAE